MSAFLLFLLPLLSHHLTVAISISGDASPPVNLLPTAKPSRETGPNRPTRLRFFWHDAAAGPDPSAVLVAQSAARSSNNFGTVKVMDDPLTAGPNRSSLLVGKSQGIYVSADKHTSGLLMAMTFSFVSGKFNGSTLAVVGRNEVKTHVREMAITGGTGLLRRASGYVQARTHSLLLRYFAVEGDGDGIFVIYIVIISWQRLVLDHVQLLSRAVYGQTIGSAINKMITITTH